MTALLGPSDADHFRIKVGRYNDRFYTDPLPACPIADASDWYGPSVSVTKPPFANKYVPMRAIADMASTEWARLATLDADARYEAIKTHDKLVGRVNMNRGSIVHRMAEDRLLGRTPLTWGEPSGEAADQAERFRPALDAFFDAYQPVLIACEVVCLHRTLNGVGYGGTADAFVEIEGDVWAVDWKSRNSDHAAYGEEAGQGGAYIGAEYMIVDDGNGGAKRAEIPKVAGVLIVSLRDDGYRAYPIDAQGAIDHYAEMHRWWVAQRDLTDHKVIGRPWAAKSTKVAAPPPPEQAPSTGEGLSLSPTPVDEHRNSSADADHRETSGSVLTMSGRSTSAEEPVAAPPPEPARRNALLARYQAMNNEQKIRFTQCLDLSAADCGRDDMENIEAIINHVDPIQTVHTVYVPPDPPESPALPSIPDEGAVVADSDVQALKKRFDALSDSAKLWTGTMIAQGRLSHHWRITDTPTTRRYELYRGVMALAEWDDDGVGDVVRAICHLVTGDEQVLFPTTEPGQLLGALDATEAARFADIATDLTQDRYLVMFDETGTLRVVTPV